MEKENGEINTKKRSLVVSSISKTEAARERVQDDQCPAQSARPERLYIVVVVVPTEAESNPPGEGTRHFAFCTPSRSLDGI